MVRLDRTIHADVELNVGAGPPAEPEEDDRGVGCPFRKTIPDRAILPRPG